MNAHSSVHHANKTNRQQWQPCPGLIPSLPSATGSQTDRASRMPDSSAAGSCAESPELVRFTDFEGEDLGGLEGDLEDSGNPALSAPLDSDIPGECHMPQCSKRKPSKPAV